MIQKRITIYQCDCCEENKQCQYKTLKTALNKKIRCGFNPENKSCITCKHSIPMEYIDANKQSIKMYNCLFDSDAYPFYKSNCDDYEYKEVTKSNLSYLNIKHLTQVEQFSELRLIDENYQYALYKCKSSDVLIPMSIYYSFDVKCNKRYRCIKVNDYYVILEQM